MPVSFLLELGCEEIPDWMIGTALEDLKAQFQKLIDASSLGGTVAWVDGTPRRLVLRADNLIDRQPDSEEVAMGPPMAAGPGAATGFAKKMGVSVDDLQTVKSAKGEYFSYTRQIKGRPTAEIIAEAIPGIVQKIYFPKTMYWTGKGGFRFIRPIRWIVALLGADVVPFEIAGVKSGNISQGHRRLGASSITVTIENYVEELRKNYVLVLAAERRARIRAGLKKLSVPVKDDPKLLETLTFITEYPTPILGGFDPQYLELPSEVLVTVMRHHQKYFSCENADGTLAPNFVAVMNTDGDPDGLVRQGNERVLRARFNDAKFFYGVDQQKPLRDRVEDLGKVTFQAKLGSYLEKAHRIVDLVQELGGSKNAERAALLCKTDLTTEMVKEFTDLQGVVGGLYAKAQGEPEGVWRAIYDHYKPLSMEDSVPATQDGLIVALADKLDTLRGCFEVGLMPTGSKDPFALRRAAQGVVKILAEGKQDFDIKALAGENAYLREFLLDRVRYYFREVRGYKYDEVNAVLASSSNSLRDVEERLTALKAVRPTENFEPLAASFKRIQNILKQADFKSGAPLDESLLEDGPEKELHAAFVQVREQAKGAAYQPALEAAATLRPAVDKFFDKVMVNVPDEKLRQNRLTLLNGLLTGFSTIADFSEIVVSS
ncbi:glycine--tRNA ligase beta subunit [Bryobacterales bacterium F-183]|nr:glycine--tRNA ligase beta subunit [Bryobacterales bacterium F-183]